MDASPPAPDSLAPLLAELRAIRAALEHPAEVPQLLDGEAAAAMLGVSDSAFYRLTALDTFPRGLQLPTVRGLRWKRAALVKWLEALRPSRREPVAAG